MLEWEYEKSFTGYWGRNLQGWLLTASLHSPVDDIQQLRPKAVGRMPRDDLLSDALGLLIHVSLEIVLSNCI